MDDAARGQIAHMLVDIINNMEQPDSYPNHADFKRDWLHAVADVASNLAKEI